MGYYKCPQCNSKTTPVCWASDNYNTWRCLKCSRKAFAGASAGSSWEPLADGDNYFLDEHEVQAVGFENTKKLIMQLHNERERTKWLQQKVLKGEEKATGLTFALVITGLILLGSLAG